MTRAHPSEFTRWCLHATQTTECSHAVALEEQHTDSARCLALSRGKLTRGLSRYKFTLILELLGQVSNQSLHQIQLVLQGSGAFRICPGL